MADEAQGRTMTPTQVDRLVLERLLDHERWHLSIARGADVDVHAENIASLQRALASLAEPAQARSLETQRLEARAAVERLPEGIKARHPRYVTPKEETMTPQSEPPSIDGWAPCIMLQCGGVLRRRVGPYGAFYGCSNYPRCHYKRQSRDVEDEYAAKVIGEVDVDEAYYGM